MAENGWQRPFCGVYAPSDEYEIVVQDIVSGLAKRAGVETTRLEHDVEVTGRATLLEPRLRSSLGGVQQPTASPIRRHAASLIGRDAERGVLDRLLDDVRGGASRALVVHGEAGMGKTALLEYLAGRASDCRVVSVAGAQAEREFGFAALHQLCVPLLNHLDAVPSPQRKALYVTFGIGAGPVPDRLLIGLAVLSLLAEVAAERPLVCLIDDQQWLDQPSAQVLAFVARRLGTESVGLVFGVRTPSAELTGLADLAVGGLADHDAQVLLCSVLTGPVDARVRDRIVAETGGNPLALLELPRGLTAAELAGGFGMSGGAALPGSVEESFRRR
ncbi:MAG: ATP-binding protein, partial [Acidimicrobiales bacterium]